ncbi:alpha/beta fold hydrolase BchO [Pontixanthobacter sp.]|uniref:alpha/beta fold hydrolase BchO n=1 Tax=Pontixanthobacter sp. TaxID=2792078 RepID=UPI003C7C0D3B
MSRRYPDWNVEGAHWPNREASRFVTADGYDWHVQEMSGENADKPVCVMIHGTGAATHSWRDLMPALAGQYRVIAMDLPGHGFTRPNHARRVTLPAMSRSIGILLDDLGAVPDLLVGHSAGAAIALQLALERQWSRPCVGLNPALLPFPGIAAKIFPTLAKILFTNPFVSQIFARRARYPGEAERFLKKATGSRIDGVGREAYRLLLTRSGHCDGAIRMMASWQLDELEARLGEISSPVMLVHGRKDSAIPRSAVQKAGALIANCRYEEIADAGHLAHEEQPEQIAALITGFVKSIRE